MKTQQGPHGNRRTTPPTIRRSPSRMPAPVMEWPVTRTHKSPPGGG